MVLRLEIGGLPGRIYPTLLRLLCISIFLSSISNLGHLLKICLCLEKEMRPLISLDTFEGDSSPPLGFPLGLIGLGWSHVWFLRPIPDKEHKKVLTGSDQQQDARKSPSAGGTVQLEPSSVTASFAVLYSLSFKLHMLWRNFGKCKSVRRRKCP